MPERLTYVHPDGAEPMRADKALAALHSLGQEAGVIGEIVSGEEKVALC